MKKVILTLVAVLACALCVFSSCNKNDQDNKVLVIYQVAPVGSTSSSIWGDYQRSMKAAILKAVEIVDAENELSYESEANDKAAIKACDEVYANAGEIDYDFSLELRKGYVARTEGKATHVALKTYNFKASKTE